MVLITIKKEFIFLIAGFGVMVFLFLKYWIYRKAGNVFYNYLKKDLCKAMFLGYAVAVVGVTLFPIQVPPMDSPYQMDFINLDIRQIFSYDSAWGFVRNNIGNVLLFLPLIPLIGINSRDKGLQISLPKALLISGLTSVLIELLQYIENICRF